MSEQNAYSYNPDFVYPPGDTILELLEEKAMTQKELAQRMGRPLKTINEIIHAKTRITAETALQLEHVLGTPARLWLRLEQAYQEHLARQTEQKELDQYLDWPDRFPVRHMERLGWLPPTEKPKETLIALLQFFAIAHPNSWADIWENCLVSYRKSRAYQSDHYALSAWLRRGEIEAQAIHCRPYDVGKFKRLLHNDLRSLTREDKLGHIREHLQALCAEVGVAVAIVPQVNGARVSGATRWLSKDKALIQLSLRYKRNDQFWFTFFHEAGHIIEHGKREVFIDVEGEAPDAQEREADLFAAEMLIPPDEYRRFVTTHIENNGRFPSHAAIEQFAESVGIAPGIVVGRLQHDEYVPYTHYNRLRRPFKPETSE